MSMTRLTAAVLVTLFWGGAAQADQRPDLEFHYANPSIAFARGTGPVVGVDAGHNNYQTAEGRFAPFARLIEDDGFRVRSLHGSFDQRELSSVNILVVVNALDAINVNRFALPTPSAFTTDEINAVGTWVKGGGSLLLIADHMPWAGAAADLAKSFGFGFVNGYVYRWGDGSGQITFTPDDGLIVDDLGVGLPPTRKFVTFTGQAFTVPDEAAPLLFLMGSYFAVLPAIAGHLEGAPTVDVSNYSQGAIRDYGAGRIAVFGEAGAFSAQIEDDGSKMGMNADGAEDNAGFVLKVMRWLAGYVPPAH